MCDDMCKERILDGDHYVCPISGYSSARLVNEWEEASAAAAKADEGVDEGPEPDGVCAPESPYPVLRHTTRIARSLSVLDQIELRLIGH